MITSVTNDKIKSLLSLQKRKNRDDASEFVIEGPHLLEEALKRNLVTAIFTNTSDYDHLDHVFIVSDAVMAKISSVVVPQGVVAIVKKPEATLPRHRLLMLDRIQDPGNLGTLLRSALAFGFDTIIYEDCVDPYNPKVLRSTQGAIFHLNLIGTNLLNFIDENPKYIYYGTALKEAFSLTTVPRKDVDVAIILGNEGSGVRSEILAKTHLNIFIDIATIESLNVAIAGSIIMYHLRRLEP